MEFLTDYTIANWYLWVLLSIAGICAVVAEIHSVERSMRRQTFMNTLQRTILSFAIFGGSALAALSAYLAVGKYILRLVAPSD